MNKPLMKKIGCEVQVKAFEAGLCPFCNKEVGKFRNALSKKEYEISGLCQECQDDMFGKD
jgi:hypothetical protein